MSSSSNRPYKSRFFNFLNRYSIRLKDKAGVAWRNVAQTSVEWGVQILLYPVYLIVQAGRFAQRQLKQTVKEVPRLIASRRKKNQESQHIGIKYPTERVLQSLQLTVAKEDSPLLPRLEIHLINPKHPFSKLDETSALAIPEKTNPSIVDDSFKIQGIVSLLDSHRLAVVTSENIVLDILTSEQQKTIAERIHLEIANYWYEKRFHHKLKRKTPGLMPSFRTTWPNVLPPVRWFWQIMRWEQTSDIAKEINLFGESSLVPVEPSPLELIPSPLLSRLDEKLSLLEEQDLVSLTQWIQQTLTQSSTDVSESPAWKVQVLIRAAVDYFFGQQTELTLSNSEQPTLTGNPEQPLIIPGSETAQKILEAVKETGGNWLYAIGDRIYDSLPDTPTETEIDPFKIWILIKSALEYYLDKEQPLLNPIESPKALPASPATPEEDPWLSWDDLFTPATETPQMVVIPQEALPYTTPAKKLNPSVTTQVPQKVSPQPTAKNAPKPSSNAPVTVNSTPVEEKPKIIHQSFPTSYDSKSEQDWPDWVEIKATPSGYEKHFLERLLGWFDQIILWIEELVIKIWNWIQPGKRNRKRNHR